MIDHLSFYAKDYEPSRVFYDAVLSALGYARQRETVAEWDVAFRPAVRPHTGRRGDCSSG